MTGILTPELALRYLLELSTDVRAAVVLDASGRSLAGDDGAVAPARELLGLLDGALGERGRELIVRVEGGSRPGGTVLVARGGRAPGSPGGEPAGQVLAVAAGPHTLLELLRHDVSSLLRDLAVSPSEEGSEEPGPGPQPLPAPPAAVVAIDVSGRAEALRPADFAVQTAIFAAEGLLAAGDPSFIAQ